MSVKVWIEPSRYAVLSKVLRITVEGRDVTRTFLNDHDAPLLEAWLQGDPGWDWEEEEGERRQVFNAVDDLAGALLWDDRKEDEDLPRYRIEELIEAGHVTVDEMVQVFREGIESRLPDDDEGQ